MLKNEYLLAKIGVDTAENEPEVEVWRINYTCPPYAEPRRTRAAPGGTRPLPATRDPGPTCSCTESIEKQKQMASRIASKPQKGVSGPCAR